MNNNEIKKEIEHQQTLITDYKKRLRALERQMAKFGINVPAHILMEIDEIENKISTYENQLQNYNNKSIIIEEIDRNIQNIENELKEITINERIEVRLLGILLFSISKERTEKRFFSSLVLGPVAHIFLFIFSFLIIILLTSFLSYITVSSLGIPPKITSNPLSSTSESTGIAPEGTPTPFTQTITANSNTVSITLSDIQMSLKNLFIAIEITNRTNQQVTIPQSSCNIIIQIEQKSTSIPCTTTDIEMKPRYILTIAQNTLYDAIDCQNKEALVTLEISSTRVSRRIFLPVTDPGCS